jgi:hypothetical protein
MPRVMDTKILWTFFEPEGIYFSLGARLEARGIDGLVGWEEFISDTSKNKFSIMCR